MARVTVEDCIDKLPNTFELVLLAARRAWSLASGPHLAAVITRREMAAKTVTPGDVSEEIIHSMHNAEGDEPGSTVGLTLPQEHGTVVVRADRLPTR